MKATGDLGPRLDAFLSIAEAVGTIARCAEATCFAPGPSPTAAHRAAGLRFTWPAYPDACAAVHPWTLARVHQELFVA